jgi:hypothetical protein
MTRAERKAMQARGAIKTLARMFAKRAVKNHIRSQGLWLGDFSSKEITLWAVWLSEHPQIFYPGKSVGNRVGLRNGRTECTRYTTIPCDTIRT